MDFAQGLNHPLAIVAILSIVFGFLAMALDKMSYFIRGVKKSTPMDKLAGSFEKLDSTMSAMTENLKLMNEQMKHQTELTHIKLDSVLYEIRTVREKRT